MFAILHKPSGKICEVENGVCYDSYATIEKAQLSISEMDSHLQGNYEVVPMPADLIPFSDSIQSVIGQKYISQLKAGDIVKAHGGTFKILHDAKPSQNHGTKSWDSVNGFTYYPEAPDCAWAKAECLTGEFKGYFSQGSEWTFQGNFLAGKLTVLSA